MKPITLDNLGKYYRVYERPRDRLIELISGRKRHRDRWALQRVDLVLSKGEAVGVIGNNGAGKSTLLKLIAGTLLPSAGRVSSQGRLTAILELGTGFHPEFSGRENLYYAGSLMGVGRQEISDRFSRIVEFAGLQPVIDQPLKTYSTGMVVRLAFSLVTSVDPEILIIDEALAVGDRTFQKRCIDRMVAIQRSGTTILFCSHSMHHVMQFCSRVLWLEQGRVKELGASAAVIDHYIAAALEENEQRAAVGKGSSDKAALPCRVDAVHLSPPGVVRRGDSLQVTIQFTVIAAAAYVFGVAIDRKETGARLVAETSLENGHPAVKIEAGHHQVRLSVATACLRSGVYTVFAGLLDDTLLQIEDYERIDFDLVDTDEIRSPALIRAAVRWDLEGRFL
jgi:ABC-type polysaccharide/polyol phosphate transport system ATPase subunit